MPKRSAAIEEVGRYGRMPRAELPAFEVIESRQLKGRPARRYISPQAGRALEIFGHAIEYLADEYIYGGGSFSARDPQIKAIQMLMDLNRQIYLACPEKRGLLERCQAILQIRKKPPSTAYRAK